MSTEISHVTNRRPACSVGTREQQTLLTMCYPAGSDDLTVLSFRTSSLTSSKENTASIFRF